MLIEPLSKLYSRIFPKEQWKSDHPFDKSFGTDTGGFVANRFPSFGLKSKQEHPYAGCQPACVRKALSTIPDPSRYSFIDLGCGKGRAMIVAAELPFRKIVGVDISKSLIKIAEGNARILRLAHPERPRIEPRYGDATKAKLPSGARVVFLYHPFGRPLVEQVVSRLLREAEAQGEELFIVYENPVHFGVLDAMSGLERWYAASVPCAPDEAGFAPEDHDVVVVWRAGGPARTALPGAEAKLVTTTPEWRVELATA